VSEDIALGNSIVRIRIAAAKVEQLNTKRSRALSIGCGVVIGTILIAVLSGFGMAQTTPDEPSKSVRISGRLVSPDGLTVPAEVPIARIEPYGLESEETVATDSQGVFTFLGSSGKRYRMYLTDSWQKIVDTASGRDVDLGDLVIEKCAVVRFAIPKAPASPELLGDLRPEQIVIEPQNLLNGESRESRALRSPAAQETRSSNTVDVPQCWSGPSLERRPEWEALCQLSFDRYVSVESFVGGKVNVVRVVRYDPKLTPSEIRDEVRKAWLGVFRSAACEINWAEWNHWNIEASVEYEDGKRTSILMDGWIHVQVQDRTGKYWYIRLFPAVQ
jgi:hypothetical protein